jgi:succinate dehydrogenase / fumarate reductase, cytochrome b subunit
MSFDPAASGGLRPRPLSPHLQIYRRQLTSVLSILHRATGVALSAGALLLVWWLVAAAAGPESYDTFSAVAGSVLGRILLFGWTLSLFYHLANGIRHLWWDTGRGLDLPSVYRSGYAVLAFTAVASLAAWILGYWLRGT